MEPPRIIIEFDYRSSATANETIRGRAEDNSPPKRVKKYLDCCARQVSKAFGLASGAIQLTPVDFDQRKEIRWCLVLRQHYLQQSHLFPKQVENKVRDIREFIFQVFEEINYIAEQETDPGRYAIVDSSSIASTGHYISNTELRNVCKKLRLQKITEAFFLPIVIDGIEIKIKVPQTTGPSRKISRPKLENFYTSGYRDNHSIVYVDDIKGNEIAMICDNDMLFEEYKSLPSNSLVTIEYSCRTYYLSGLVLSCEYEFFQIIKENTD